MSTLAFTVCFAVWTIFSIIGIRIRQDLGLSDTEFGLLIGTPILTGSLIRVALGVWADVYGGRVVFALTCWRRHSPPSSSPMPRPTPNSCWQHSASASSAAPSRWASPKSRAGIRQAGMIAAAFSVPASLFRAYGGHLSDVYGARRVMYWTFLVSGPPRDQEEAVIRALLEQEVKVPTADEATCRRNFARNPALFRTGDDGGRPRRASDGAGHLILSGYFYEHCRNRPMSFFPARPCTAFAGTRLLRSGPLVEVAMAVKAAMAEDSAPLLVFDDTTGRVIDLDLRGSDAEVIARLDMPKTPAMAEPSPPAKGRGRPKLGVVAREVTLLPRHWDWLAAQPSGASATLRRLVDEARRREAPQQQRRTAQSAAYHFMQALAGDFAGYEEATRALFADDRDGLVRMTAGWPADVRAHVLRLAFDA